MKNILSILCFISTLYGCTASVPMKSHEIQKIKSLSIAPEIEVSETLYYYGDETRTWGMVAGGIGAALASQAPAERIRLLAIKNNIFIEDIVKNTLSHNLCRKINCSVTDKTTADAVLSIKIPVYGISLTGPFSNDYAPVLKIEAQIATSKEVIWKNDAYINPVFSSENLLRFSIYTIDSKPNILKEAWQSAVIVATQKLLSNIAP